MRGIYIRQNSLFICPAITSRVFLYTIRCIADALWTNADFLCGRSNCIKSFYDISSLVQLVN